MIHVKFISIRKWGSIDFELLITHLDQTKQVYKATRRSCRRSRSQGQIWRHTEPQHFDSVGFNFKRCPSMDTCRRHRPYWRCVVDVTHDNECRAVHGIGINNGVACVCWRKSCQVLEVCWIPFVKLGMTCEMIIWLHYGGGFTFTPHLPAWI